MLRLLSRYMLGDLVRLTLLTTAVLVTVIAFGAAIKPLAKDNLLSLGQTVKYITLAIVPMLQFALPFAAGFAGTMSLHRMTSDNEILAASVAGLSYRRLLAPAAGLGVALTVVMLLLTQWVVPRFWGFLENAVRTDLTRVFEATIERGEPFQFGDRQIFADRLVVQPGPEGSEVDTRLALFRLAAADLGEDGRIDRDVTAARAVVDVYRRTGYTYLKLTMADTVAYDPEGGMLAWAERLDSRTIAIPSASLEDARHKTRGELLELRRRPDLYGSVLHRKMELADALRDEALWAQLDVRLTEGQAVELAAVRPGGPRYVVRAGRLRGGRFSNRDGRAVEVEQVAETPVRRFVSRDVRLVRREAVPGAEPTFDLVLVDCAVTDLATGATNLRGKPVPLENLAVHGFAAPDLTGLSCDELLERAEREAGPDGHRLTAFADTLRQKIDSFQLEITARLQKRNALSLTALLLVMLGATLAMWLRGSLPLTIYLWAFLPSIADLILISSGAELIRGGSVVGGLALLWSGNAVLVGLLLVAFLRLSRH